MIEHSLPVGKVSKSWASYNRRRENKIRYNNKLNEETNLNIICFITSQLVGRCLKYLFCRYLMELQKPRRLVNESSIKLFSTFILRELVTDRVEKLSNKKFIWETNIKFSWRAFEKLLCELLEKLSKCKHFRTFLAFQAFERKFPTRNFSTYLTCWCLLI